MRRGRVYIATNAPATICRFLGGNQFGDHYRASRKRQLACRFLHHREERLYWPGADCTGRIAIWRCIESAEPVYGRSRRRHASGLWSSRSPLREHFAVSAQGTSGGLAHNASLTLAIQGTVIGADFPRTTFVRTDSAPAADNPAGEAHHRHLIYDPAHQHLFIANRAMNRLEVISTVDQSTVAQIAIAGVTSADLSADGSTVWAGTAVNEIVAVDSTSLRITRRYQQAGISPLPSTVFDRPAEVLS
jgi:hypothetical protein